MKHDYLDSVSGKDKAFDNRCLDAMYSDASGLLVGISQGTIRSGRPRIVEQLIQIAQNYLEGNYALPITEAIAACGNAPILACGHTFPGTFRIASVAECLRSLFA